jgi:hypothetical protein
MKHVPEADLDYYFDRLLPRDLPEADPQDETDCAIKKRHIYILGREDRGKDNTAKWIENEAASRYGKKRVSVDLADAQDFGVMLRTKWRHTDIQFKMINDATEVSIPSEEIHSFFTIRHEMMKRTGFRSGLCATVMLCHRIHNTPASMREGGYDSLLILSPPAKGSWDWNFLKNLVGEAALKELQKRDIEAQLDSSGQKKGYMLVIYENEFLGITKIPKLRFASKVREIEASETQLDGRLANGRQNVNVQVPVPLKEKALLLAMTLFPWLAIYSIIRYPYAYLAIVGLSAIPSAGYVAARISRYLKKPRRKKSR